MKKPPNRTKKLKDVKKFGSKEPEIRVSSKNLSLSFTSNVFLGQDKIRRRRRALLVLLSPSGNAATAGQSGWLFAEVASRRVAD